MLETIGIAFAIFTLRVVGNWITTVRLIFLNRGKIFIVSVLGFFEALTFAIAIGSVVTNLGSILNLMMYCLGYAAGGHLAMIFEKRLLQGFVLLRAISKPHGREIAQAVRVAGLGATEITGQGAQGEVVIVESIVDRRNISQWTTIVQKVDPKAFITNQPLNSRLHGYIPSVRPGLARIVNRE